ncbi:class I SAM-dependent methyltransferase [Patescibacteria group bacterium]
MPIQLFQLCKKNNWLSFGINISLTAMQKAKAKADKLGLADQTAFVVCSLENLPFKENIFEYVSVLSVLEHIQNDELVISNLNKSLKSNGHLYVCVPNSYKNIYSFLKPIYKLIDKKVGHLRHYSLESLNSIFKNFKLEKYFYNAHLIKLWQLILEKLHLINNKNWWRLEKKDINQNKKGLQLNAIYKKSQKQ